MITIEQELEAIKEAQGYAVRLADTSYLHVYLYKDGKQIDHKLYTRWLWHRRRAARWVRRSIRDHELFLRSTGARVL